MQKAPKAT